MLARAFPAHESVGVFVSWYTSGLDEEVAEVGAVDSDSGPIDPLAYM